jgi:hypothetical protein
LVFLICKSFICFHFYFHSNYLYNIYFFNLVLVLLIICFIYYNGGLTRPLFLKLQDCHVNSDWFKLVFFVFFYPIVPYVFNETRIELHPLSLFTHNISFSKVIFIIFYLIWSIFCHLIKIKPTYLTHFSLWLKSYIFSFLKHVCAI